MCRKCKKVAHRTVFGQVDLEHELDPDSGLSGLKTGNLLSTNFIELCLQKKLSNIIRVLSVFILTRQPLTPTTHFLKLVNYSYTLPFKIEF